MTEMPWKRVAEHAPTGNRIFQRTVDFSHTGNNEGTMTDKIEVRDPDGTVIASTEMTIEWEYFGSIDAGFSDGGKTVTVRGSDGDLEKLPLNGPGGPVADDPTTDKFGQRRDT